MTQDPWVPHSRNLLELLSRWGAGVLSTAFPLFKGVLPVVLVDRFRGPDEGNLWVITAETAGAAGEHSTVGIASGEAAADWELLNITVNDIPFGSSTSYDHGFHVSTPVLGATDPVQNNLLVGFVPGIITDLPVTLSPLRGFSGTSPFLLAPLGEIYRPNLTGYPSGVTWHQETVSIPFDPPLRVYGAGRGVVVQTLNPGGLPGQPQALSASFRFRVRPRRANL